MTGDRLMSVFGMDTEMSLPFSSKGSDSRSQSTAKFFTENRLVAIYREHVKRFVNRMEQIHIP